MERPVEQILVVVASIKMRTWKTEGEKGSMPTAIGHGLASPKRSGNSVTKGGLGAFGCLLVSSFSRKGIWSKFQSHAAACGW